MSINARFQVIAPVLGISQKRVFPSWWSYVYRYVSKEKRIVHFTPGTLIKWLGRIYGTKTNDLVISKAELYENNVRYSLHEERLRVLEEDFKDSSLVDCNIAPKQSDSDTPHNIYIGEPDGIRVTSGGDCKLGRRFIVAATEKHVILDCMRELEDVIKQETERMSASLKLPENDKMEISPVLICIPQY